MIKYINQTNLPKTMVSKIYPNHKIIALIFDADGTIHEKYMYRKLFRRFNFDENEFFNSINQLRDELKKQGNIVGDGIVYFSELIDFFKENNIKLTNEMLIESGKELIHQAYPGMPGAMQRYKEYAKEKYSDLGIVVENYIISSGSRKMLQGSCFNECVNEIYAFDTYMRNNEIKMSYIMEDTMKTQALFLINKNSNNNGINHNTTISHENRRIPFELMIGFEDGETGIPMLSLIKDRGGSTIGIYGQNECDKFVKQLYEKQKIHAYFEANYSEDSILDQYIKQEIDNKVELIRKSQLKL
jgi:hypothetical protein